MTIVAPTVLLLLDADDVAGPAEGGEQIAAVLAVDEALQRLGARRQADEVVLLADRERGRDQVVADAALAQMDLEAVGEEGDQIAGRKSGEAIAIAARGRNDRIAAAAGAGRSRRSAG